MERELVQRTVNTDICKAQPARLQARGISAGTSVFGGAAACGGWGHFGFVRSEGVLSSHVF
eukprot:2016749-Lingulodinium_polyedra.AAC.1